MSEKDRHSKILFQELAGKFFSLPLVEVVEEGGGVRQMIKNTPKVK